MKTILVISLLGWFATPAPAQSCFEGDPWIVTDQAPSSVALGDLDGDGDVDLGVTESLGPRVRLFWNQGDGTWGSPTWVDAPYSLTHLEFADVDGDGDADILYTNINSLGSLTVRRNLGAQAFGPVETYPVFAPEHFVCADLDNDADLDIAIAAAGVGGFGVSQLMKNQGNGTFVEVLGTVQGPTRVAVADFDLDGDRDLAWSRSDSSVILSLNDGTGAFPTGGMSPIPVGANSTDLTAGDFDADGRPDLAVAREGNLVSILISVAGGSFAPYVAYSTPHVARDVEVEDFDGDGDLDLSVLDPLSQRVTVLANAGDGTFAVAGTHELGAAAYVQTSGDVDGDGDPDLAFPMVAFNCVRLLRNCGSIGARACFGDGSAAACPCGNASTVGADAGCLHSLGAAGTLRASGIPSLTADSIVLRGASMPNAPVLYFQGTSTINGGLGSTFGDGLRCVGGSVARLGTATNVAGSSQYPVAGQSTVSLAGGVTSPGERHYQVWFRNAASFCTPSTFNLTNSLRLTWRP